MGGVTPSGQIRSSESDKRTDEGVNTDELLTSRNWRFHSHVNGDL